MLTASEIVDRLGGTSAVAAALKLTASVVSSWRTANSIPRWWRAGVMAMPPPPGTKPIKASDFRDKPRPVAARIAKRAA